jgi:hypothetical protein
MLGAVWPFEAGCCVHILMVIFAEPSWEAPARQAGGMVVASLAADEIAV